MRSLIVVIFVVVLLSSCADNRIYENDREFTDRIWKAADTADFQFDIKDPAKKYTIYYNVRNSADYPWSRLFVRYSLCDAAGKELHGKLASAFLFDQKTGKPFGSSGLGDVYDHQFPILTGYQFKNAGAYKIKLVQFMRMDSLIGILAVGVRVETTKAD